MSEEQAAALLARLLAVQQELGLTDTQLARELGLRHGGYIARLRAGQKGRRLTLAFALRAAGRFPELRVFLLPTDLPIITSGEIIGNSEEDTES